MVERGLSLSHTTIMRWIKRLTPEFVKRWNRFAISAGRSWRVDETKDSWKMDLSLPCR
jgi:transposase-like protein